MYLSLTKKGISLPGDSLKYYPPIVFYYYYLWIVIFFYYLAIVFCATLQWWFSLLLLFFLLTPYTEQSVMESSVINKYSAQIAKANECFTFGRDLFSFWNTTRITFLSMIMQKSDFYLYLIENQFIVAEYVKCKKCDGKMNFRLNKSKPEGCVWACNNKIGVGIKATKCNSSRSARVNSWFYKSKLSMQEILLLSYLWWSKLPPIHIQNEFHFSSTTLVD